MLWLAQASFYKLQPSQKLEAVAGNAPEREEGVADKDDVRGLAPDRRAEVGHVAVARDVDEPHPAEGEHEAVERRGHEQEGQEKAIIPLHTTSNNLSACHFLPSAGLCLDQPGTHAALASGLSAG